MMADILHKITIKAVAGRVYAALSQPAGLAGWWTNDVQAEDRVGTIAKFRFGGGTGPDMEILELVPDTRVMWRCVAHSDGNEWINSELTFDLEALGDKTVVRFSHRRWARESDFFRYCSLKWATFLLSLKGLLERGEGTPWPRDVET
jgi:uncharacterized protein YndB with AHSA1/START domain